MNALKLYVQNVLNERIRSTSVTSPHGDLNVGPFKLEQFKKMSGLAQMQNYVVKRLEYVAEGSSRQTFVLTSTKVLKLAINRAGIAQNEQEVEVFTDPRTKDITTRIYEYDPDFFWIVSELVKPFDDKDDIEEFLDVRMPNATVTAVDFYDFVLDASVGDEPSYESRAKLPNRVKQDLERIAKMIEDLVDHHNMLPGDLAKESSWGRSSDGRLVLLDYGFTHRVRNDHYT